VRVGSDAGRWPVTLWLCCGGEEQWEKHGGECRAKKRRAGGCVSRERKSES